MRKPVVAIVGRPNVGKSTLFNRIIGERIAIVEDTPGVTRDRLYSEAEWQGKVFDLIDTGGLEFSEDLITTKVREQIEKAINEADLILFVCDSREGITSTDEAVAKNLRKSDKPVILVANKVDDYLNPPANFYDLYRLGLGEPFPISAANGTNVGDLLDLVISKLNFPEDYEDENPVVKIAVVGRPNVGKSSLVNALLGEERVVVSDIPGTTRDAIDTPMWYQGKPYLLIDTAGMRRKSRIEEDLERYSVNRSIKAIRRADVALLVISAEEGVTEQDKKIAGLIHEYGRGVIIVVNKWDLIEKDAKTADRYKEHIYFELGFLKYAPVIFVSAKTGQRLNKLMELVDRVSFEHQKRVATSILNQVLREAVVLNPPPADRGRPLKIYYATQIETKPPTFALFVNDAELMHFSYLRYLENVFRQNFGFEGTTLKFVLRERGRTT
ncbi:ribosome biogenesis GTPase Der [Carboxydothermus ferrireducens]|uniref:GTPase Der n=1 Tax=Carboxydothermus ferrireducens DSM 11255 TaxID=1119529 RepID=A0ABX2RF18_9THEO|nr:ribosome biogenesis GTPase Der [Carboxydothermus ferrireducens]NYE58633.1 GTP-binding protein [Carboxydothermus ferrireducens DSM 11255]